MSRVSWTFFDSARGDIFCERCGGRSAVPMPAPIPVFVAATKAFNKLHRNCKPKEG